MLLKRLHYFLQSITGRTESVAMQYSLYTSLLTMKVDRPSSLPLPNLLPLQIPNIFF